MKQGRISPARWAAIAIVVASSGCGAETDNLPRQAISGTVTLDGSPLSRGSITLEPDDPGRPGAVSVAGTITNGSFSVSRAEGPTPGKYRVSIIDVPTTSAVDEKVAPGMPPKRKKGASSDNLVPARYNSKSTLSAEVKPGDSAPLDFALTTAK